MCWVSWVKFVCRKPAAPSTVWKKAQPQSSPHLGLMCSVQSVQCGATVRQLCLAVPCSAQVDEATKECVNHNQRNACWGGNCVETLTGGEVGWTPVEPTDRLASPHLRETGKDTVRQETRTGIHRLSEWLEKEIFLIILFWKCTRFWYKQKKVTRWTADAAGGLSSDLRVGAIWRTLTVLSTAPEKRRPLETASAVTLPWCLSRVWVQIMLSMLHTYNTQTQHCCHVWPCTAWLVGWDDGMVSSGIPGTALSEVQPHSAQTDQSRTSHRCSVGFRSGECGAQWCQEHPPTTKPTTDDSD